MTEFRRRVYEAYRTTTSANCYGQTSNMLISSQLRQSKQRWGRFLPNDLKAHFLDIGCGSGEFLLLLQESGYDRIEGIDISPEQVEAARRLGLGQVVPGDARSYLMTRHAVYDVISAQNILEHMDRDKLFDLLDAIVAALKPGGCLFAMVPNAKSPFGARVRYADITHELSFTPESILQICTVVGLEPVYIGECGPVVHGIISFFRWCIWQMIRLVFLIVLIAQGNDYHFRVYTQDMLVVLRKKK